MAAKRGSHRNSESGGLRSEPLSNRSRTSENSRRLWLFLRDISRVPKQNSWKNLGNFGKEFSELRCSGLAKGGGWDPIFPTIPKPTSSHFIATTQAPHDCSIQLRAGVPTARGIECKQEAPPNHHEARTANSAIRVRHPAEIGENGDSQTRPRPRSQGLLTTERRKRQFWWFWRFACTFLSGLSIWPF